MNKSVLDASAFLAYLRDEPGAEIVENALINGCYTSIIIIIPIVVRYRFLGFEDQEVKILVYLMRLGNAINPFLNRKPKSSITVFPP